LSVKCYLNFAATDSDSGKLDKYHSFLEDPLLDLDGLRQLSWSGIPIKVRAITWRLLAVSDIVKHKKLFDIGSQFFAMHFLL
jgi:hypothetical protein